jgi:2-amino-4-hydroxy-6-hydroxymethyldihydropteridine diphosphokinase
MLVYIGVGSNLKQPPQQIAAALRAMKQIPQTRLLRRAPWYGSRAIGPGEQADYLNGVIELESALSPQALLQHLQNIEQQQGRTRTLHWGPRTLDLDILLYGKQILNDAQLHIPHPHLTERAFVLIPLACLNPDLQVPLPDGKSATIAALLDQLPPDAKQDVWLAEDEHNPVPL